jgi:hypothetical protein
MKNQKKIIYKMNHETKLPRSLIKDAPSSGPFDDFAEWILQNYRVEVSLEDSIQYLSYLGAWDREELQDLELNKARLLWVSILDCKENKTNHWLMGL